MKNKHSSSLTHNIWTTRVKPTKQTSTAYPASLKMTPLSFTYFVGWGKAFAYKPLNNRNIQKAKSVCIYAFGSWLPCWVTDDMKVCHCASCHLGRPTVCQGGNSPLKRGIQLKMSLNNKQVWRKHMSFSFIYSSGAKTNRTLLEAWPLKHTTDILLQVWFHVMGYVVHVYWLEVSKPDWSFDLALVWFYMQIKWQTPLSDWTLRHIIKVSAILFSLLKGTFHCCCSIVRWTCNLSYRKFWMILQHPYGNHINLGLHQHYSCDRLSPIPECHASERPGSPWDRWLTLNKPQCITRGLHMLFCPSFRTFHSSSVSPFFYTTSTLPSSFFYLVT